MMKDEVIRFIEEKSFPCVMAKSVIKRGHLQVYTISNIETKYSISQVLSKLWSFIDSYRANATKLSSFILVLEDKVSFEVFERRFWHFLEGLNARDKKYFTHDLRVSANPKSNNYSFSIKSEAFFILALHPESPRWARRFKYPAIVFNPHQQFEELRAKGIFKRVRDLIRLKDELLQGFSNPMMKDHGEMSEIYQYIGKTYFKNEPFTSGELR